jgi:hypothetical protein
LLYKLNEESSSNENNDYDRENEVDDEGGGDDGDDEGGDDEGGDDGEIHPSSLFVFVSIHTPSVRLYAAAPSEGILLQCCCRPFPALKKHFRLAMDGVPSQIKQLGKRPPTVSISTILFYCEAPTIGYLPCFASDLFVFCLLPAVFKTTTYPT